MNFRKTLLKHLIITSLFSWSPLALSENRSVNELIHQCLPSSHWHIMSSIVKIESNNQYYAIGVNVKPHKSYFPKTKKEAKKIIKLLIKQNKSFDIGLTSINSTHFKKNNIFGRQGLTHYDALEPCLNLKMGATIFSENYRHYKDIGKALSAYNTGNASRGFENGYIDRYIKLIEPN